MVYIMYVNYFRFYFIKLFNSCFLCIHYMIMYDVHADHSLCQVGEENDCCYTYKMTIICYKSEIQTWFTVFEVLVQT